MTHDYDTCMTSESCGLYVIKEKFDGDNIRTVVSRSCMTKKDCPKANGKEIQYVETCVVCKTDYCNGGNVLNISFFIIFLCFGVLLIKN